jgi:hypothetical protein
VRITFGSNPAERPIDHADGPRPAGRHRAGERLGDLADRPVRVVVVQEQHTEPVNVQDLPRPSVSRRTFAGLSGMSSPWWS